MIPTRAAERSSMTERCAFRCSGRLKERARGIADAFDLAARPAVPWSTGVSALSVSPPDEPVGGDRGERHRDRFHAPIAHLEREQAVTRGRVCRAGVDLGEVDRDTTGLGGAKTRNQLLGTRGGLVFRADLGFGAPGRATEEDRSPRVTDVAGDGPVAGRRCRRDPLAPCPSGGLVEEAVLIEVGILGQALRGRAVTEDRPDRRTEDGAQVKVDRAYRPVEVDLLVDEPA